MSRREEPSLEREYSDLWWPLGDEPPEFSDWHPTMGEPMNISEANATIRVLRRLGLVYPETSDPFSTPAVFGSDVLLLCERAGRALQVTVRARPGLPDWLDAVDSDGAAQAVCRALAEHQSHGGAIPWPSVAQPFDGWQRIQEPISEGVDP